MRKPIIAGNWKMNKTNAEAEALINELKPLVARARAEVVVCVPYTDLTTVGKLIEGTKIHLGAQNVSWADKGAFTGEISADMLKELGVEYVIIGHSERRQYFGETDESVNKRVKQALAKGLKPIVCVGETLVEREKNRTKRVLKKQIVEGLAGIEDFTDVVIAYEPVWAIGTGKTASDADAEEICKFIRGLAAESYCHKTAEELIVLYGGSVKPENTKCIIAQPDIDGVLVGGASLKPESFIQIVKNAL